jgi:hypothetical protein
MPRGGHAARKRAVRWRPKVALRAQLTAAALTVRGAAVYQIPVDMGVETVREQPLRSAERSSRTDNNAGRHADVGCGSFARINRLRLGAQHLDRMRSSLVHNQ